MGQHRDVLHRVKRQVMPISAIAFVPAAKLGDNSVGWMRNRGDIDSIGRPTGHAPQSFLSRGGFGRRQLFLVAVMGARAGLHPLA
jgi:hypothetical protein